MREEAGRLCRIGVMAVAVALLALGGPQVAGAQDNSLDSYLRYLKFFDSDNQVEWSAPAVSWHCFDMAYYNGMLYKMFYRAGFALESRHRLLHPRGGRGA